MPKKSQSARLTAKEVKMAELSSSHQSLGETLNSIIIGKNTFIKLFQDFTEKDGSLMVEMSYDPGSINENKVSNEAISELNFSNAHEEKLSFLKMLSSEVKFVTCLLIINDKKTKRRNPIVIIDGTVGLSHINIRSIGLTQAVMTFLLIRGDWPSNSDNRIPKILEVFLQHIGITATTESELLKILSDGSIKIPCTNIVPNKIKLPLKLANRVRLNAAGHKFINLCYKTKEVLGTEGTSMAIIIIRQITEHYSQGKVYSSLLPFCRSSTLPTNKFIENICSMIGEALTDDQRTKFKTLLNQNEVRPELMAYIDKTRVVSSWRNFNPSTWDREIIDIDSQ